MYIATYIHNQDLGRVYLYDTFEDALKQAHAMAVDLLDRNLSESELLDLDEIGTVFIEQDHDNCFTFCIGVVEE